MSTPTDIDVIDLLAALIRMDDARKLDIKEHESCPDYGRRMFCDGGASRLTLSIELIRAALGLPCEWREAAERELEP